MARKFLKYDTKNCPSNVDAKGCLIGEGGAGGGSKKRHLLFEEVYFADDATIPLFENISAEKKAELEIKEDGCSNLFKNHRMILYVTENLSGDREKLVLECLDAENLYDPTKGVFATWVFSNSGKFVLAKMGFQAGFNKIVVKADSDIKPTSTRVTCYLEEL